MKGNNLVSDLEIGVEKEIIITKNLIKKALILNEKKSNKRRTLDLCINTAHGFTQLTEREIRFLICSNFPRKLIFDSNIKKVYEGVNLKYTKRISIPKIGTKEEVNEPEFNLNIYEDDLYDKKGNLELFLPIFDLHTHPSDNSLASKADLKSSKNSYNYLLEFDDDVVLDITNPKIYVITSVTISSSKIPLTKSNQFFFQFTGDYEALDYLLKKYDKIKKLKPKNFIKILEKSGAFKAMYFPEENLFKFFSLKEEIYLMNKEKVKEIAEKFQYSIKIERIE